MKAQKNEALAYYKNAYGFVTTAKAFNLYSKGYRLKVKVVIENGKIVGRDIYKF